ncbi:MAG: thiamine pyrophosphate-binding protein [Rhodospirillales bacterium]|jgi:acetolactate synthase-1/2/3 large subunit
MNDSPQKSPNYASEAPVNLPSNKPKPEYGSDVMVDMLGNLGFDFVALTPGSTFRGIHDSLVNYGRNHKPTVILCPHEEIAVSFAQGYAKVTGKPCAVILHNLVGLQHAMMSFWNAMADRAPMFIIGGSGPIDPAERRYIDWLHSANAQSDIMRPYTKWTDEPPTLPAVLDSMAKAYRVSLNAPKGLTYVSIDTGLQEAKLDGEVPLPDMSLPRYQPSPLIAANQDSIDQAADMLTEASLPLVIGGRFGMRAEVTQPLVELVELTGAAYQEGKDVVCFPTDHEQNVTGGFGPTKESEIRGEADVWLTIDGHDIADLAGSYGKARGGGYGYIVEGGTERKIIDLSINDLSIDNWATLGGALPPVDHRIFADPLHGLHQLLDELKQRAEGNPAWRKRAQENTKAIALRHKKLRANQQQVLKDHWDDSPISVIRLIHEVYDAVKDKDWFLANRNYRTWYEGVWSFSGGGQYPGNNNGGGVGYGPGGVVGSALAAHQLGKFTVAIMGDGDFTMNPSAIWTAGHYKIPLLIVLHNNKSFGNDEVHQIKLATERDRPEENAWIGQKMVAPEPDYAGVARAYGAWAEGPVTVSGDITAVLKRAIAEVEKGGVALVDVQTQLS